MLKTEEYLEIVNKRGEEGKPLNRVYRNIRRQELFLTAYSKLYSNEGATTKGIDPEDTVDGMSVARIEKIITLLKEGKYQWKPARRIDILKSDGRKRPIAIASWNDKLVQEAIRSVLSAYYEPQFSDNSHGFRPGRGCHTSLKQIEATWTGTKWFIKGDLKGCFDEIDHDKLLAIISRNVQDQRLLKLLRQMLKAGYMEDWRYHQTYSGTPQGGVLSPLLANIYLNELDRYIEEELIPEYTKGKHRKDNPEWKRLTYQIAQARKAGKHEEAAQLRKARNVVPTCDPFDPNYRRLRYQRYADDIILGFAGPKSEAMEIKEKIKDFLKAELNLALSEEKSLITNAKTGKARYLGYDIHALYSPQRRTINGKIALRVPKEVTRKWLRKVTRKGKITPRPELLSEPDYDIVARYKTELIGLTNYYQMAVDVGTKLHRVRYAYVWSAIKTLANKHKTTVPEIARKHYQKAGNGMLAHIEVRVQREGKEDLIVRLGEKSINHVKTPKYLEDKVPPPQAHKTTKLIDRLLAERCELCGAENVGLEIHHVKKLKDLKKRYRGRKDPPLHVKIMIAMNRKTIALCKPCHIKVHNGG
jgi:group II intron reverse transcriptase/maturase